MKRYESQPSKSVSKFVIGNHPNIYSNLGKRLLEIVALESMIDAKKSPKKYMDGNYRVNKHRYKDTTYYYIYKEW